MRVLLIGASTNPSRISNQVTRLLIRQDHEVIAIGRSEGKIDNLEIITKLPKVENIDTVTLYINPSLQSQYFDFVVGLSPRRVIFNPGTENGVFYKILNDHNIDYEEACNLVLLRTGQF